MPSRCVLTFHINDFGCLFHRAVHLDLVAVRLADHLAQACYHPGRPDDHLDPLFHHPVHLAAAHLDRLAAERPVDLGCLALFALRQLNLLSRLDSYLLMTLSRIGIFSHNLLHKGPQES